jgi:hypothetical protein
MPHLLVWSLLLYFPFEKPYLTLAFPPNLLLAEETLVNQPVEISSPQHASNPSSPRTQPSSSQAETSTSPEMNPSSLQPEASDLPGTAPTSPQLEASALPGTPQTPPQLITQEIPLEPEQTSPPVQETRIEVSVNTCTFISISINHP